MTSNDRTPLSGPDGEINLFVVWRVMWAYRYLISLVCAVCLGIALWFALSAVPTYKAEVVVTEASDSEMNLPMALANQLGGLAGLAGLNLPSGGARHDSEAVLESRHLIEEFIVRNGLLQELAPGAPNQLTMWNAVQRFQRGMLSIRQDARKGVTTVTVEWRDPVVAARWANAFVALANEVVRTRAVEESRRNIAYLNDQIDHTSVIGLRSALYNLIENETKTLMLANSRSEYAFTVIDPAERPGVRASPQRTLIVSAGLGFGLLIGGVIAMAHDSWRRHRLDLVPNGAIKS